MHYIRTGGFTHQHDCTNTFEGGVLMHDMVGFNFTITLLQISS